MFLSEVHLKSVTQQKTRTDWICMAWELSSRLLLTPCLDCEKLFEYRLPYSTKAISGLYGPSVETSKCKNPRETGKTDKIEQNRPSNEKWIISWYRNFFQFFSFKIPFEWPCAWFYSKMSSASVTIYRIFLDLTAIVLIDPYIIQII